MALHITSCVIIRSPFFCYYNLPYKWHQFLVFGIKVFRSCTILCNIAQLQKLEKLQLHKSMSFSEKVATLHPLEIMETIRNSKNFRNLKKKLQKLWLCVLLLVVANTQAWEVLVGFWVFEASNASCNVFKVSNVSRLQQLWN